MRVQTAQKSDAKPTVKTMKTTNLNLYAKRVKMDRGRIPKWVPKSFLDRFNLDKFKNLTSSKKGPYVEIAGVELAISRYRGKNVLKNAKN